MHIKNIYDRNRHWWLVIEPEDVHRDTYFRGTPVTRYWKPIQDCRGVRIVNDQTAKKAARTAKPELASRQTLIWFITWSGWRFDWRRKPFLCYVSLHVQEIWYRKFGQLLHFPFLTFASSMRSERCHSPSLTEVNARRQTPNSTQDMVLYTSVCRAKENKTLDLGLPQWEQASFTLLCDEAVDTRVERASEQMETTRWEDIVMATDLPNELKIIYALNNEVPYTKTLAQG